MKRQLTDAEKSTVRLQQTEPDGSLRCFISGEIISGSDDIEYDHVHPFSKDGDTSTANIRIVLKLYNRRKSDQSLYEVRDNLRLERLFQSKKNHIKLQDILELKDVARLNSNGSVCLNSFSRKISGAIAWWMCSGKHSNRKLISLWSFFFADGGFSAATLA